MTNRTNQTERVRPIEDNKPYGTMGLYPIEIVGLKTIEQHDNRTIRIYVCPALVKGDHKPEGFIRVKAPFNLKAMVEYLRSLQTYSTSYITELVKTDFDHRTPTLLRHTFANLQTDLYGSDKIASKKAMRHNSIKNMAYYVDYIEICDKKGLEYAEDMIGKTEHSQMYSIIRLAMRRELKDYFEAGHL